MKVRTTITSCDLNLIALRRDSLDPDFASNLSSLGPVLIRDAGKFMRTPSQTQRTLNARRAELTNSPSSAPPPGHLTAPLLLSLLDRLKSMPGAADRRRVYAEYGMNEAKMEEVRRWVNSPSVGPQVDVRVVDGEEIRGDAGWVFRCPKHIS